MSLLLAAAPAVAHAMPLRPRLWSFPIVIALLCAMWIGLLWYALPGFKRRHAAWAAIVSSLLVASMIPRLYFRYGAVPSWAPTFYTWVVLPATVIQVAVLAGLVSAPLWVPLGRLVRRRLQQPAETNAAPPVVDTPPVVNAAPPVADASPPVADASPPAAEAPPAPPLPLATRRLPAPAAPLISRRSLLAAAPWVLPTGALAGAAYGVLIESERLIIRRIRIAIPGLPPELDGLRIGQVTDIHVAKMQTQLYHLERALQRLSEERLDLLCPTGDLCDEPRLHLDVLRLIRQVPTRLGHFACLGNHELYLGDLPWVRRSYERADIHLLEDESVKVGGLRLAGISFPHSGRMPRLDHALVPRLLDETLRDQGRDETTVLLAHHPHVVQHVSGRRVALQLSGHTHGGQLGIGEGSLIEPLYAQARGRYTLADGAQLFVSSGLGHWLPFRLNCPPEAVIIELARAEPQRI
ncbi:MAG: metallophosphoesterase [Polyangia bacterium]